MNDGSTRKTGQSVVFAFIARRANREDRQKVMEAFFGGLGEYRAHIRIDHEFQRAERPRSMRVLVITDGARGEPGRAQHSGIGVFAADRREVNASLPAFHRYLQAAQADAGHDRTALLRFVCAARVIGEYRTTRYEEAEQRRARALAPLGASTRDVGQSAPSTNAGSTCFPPKARRSGAYSTGGAYDVHPYMLLNYNGKYNDVSTLAHELGHTMHSYFSNKTQPYRTLGLPDVCRRSRARLSTKRC